MDLPTFIPTLKYKLYKYMPFYAKLPIFPLVRKNFKIKEKPSKFGQKMAKKGIKKLC